MRSAWSMRSAPRSKASAASWSETETAEALVRVRVAEERTRAALAEAEEERRRSRRERDEAMRTARGDAERMVDEVRAEVKGIRRKLERETLTQSDLDEDLAHASAQLERFPNSEPEAPRPVAATAVAWRIGMRARTRTGGAEGRVAALERGGKRATLEAGGLRITVAVEDLELAVGGETEGSRPVSGRSADVRPRPLEPTINASASRLQLERARTVATSLDLRGATVGEALEVLDRYLDDASLAGLSQATVIHGMGTGALRDAVRDHVSGHPLVGSWRPGGRDEGGDGATVVSL